MDDYVPRSRPRTVSSLFANLERVLAMRGLPGAQSSLGVRWSFGLPADPAPLAREYGLPLCPGGFLSLLSQRSGITVTARTLDDEPSLERHLTDSGTPAIVAVDSFYLPYRPAFGRVHSGRTLIVTPGGDERHTYVIDAWEPGYEGLLAWADLHAARRSTLEAEPRREPIFAGWPILGEWYAVAPGAIPAPSQEQVLGRLRTLYQDATDGNGAGPDRYGIDALSELARWLTAGSGAREASLLLRAELSTRVYLCAYFLSAARTLDDPLLSAATGIYYRALGHMEAARDVLTKSLAHPGAEYDAFVGRRLASAVAAEYALAEVLQAYG